MNCYSKKVEANGSEHRLAGRPLRRSPTASHRCTLCLFLFPHRPSIGALRQHGALLRQALSRFEHSTFHPSSSSESSSKISQLFFARLTSHRLPPPQAPSRLRADAFRPPCLLPPVYACRPESRVLETKKSRPLHDWPLVGELVVRPTSPAAH
ncbi:hypothetical protein DTO271G3_8363 [Paecilomyces variotii]|nr:hypothetical protein DTO271G3_8363 [Paecilomyces variotii]